MAIREALREFGADPEAAMRRLLGDEKLFHSLLAEFGKDPDIMKLERCLREGDRSGAFHAAHNLKGGAAVLSLRPLEASLSLLTEDLREEPGMPWEADYKSFLAALDRYRKILEEKE
ncbi:MAG: Hpt domain-containing protein [Stomatobaculum sp.]|nr:Hpt domain-containing protein [Stomatobaculum sp.]